MCCETKERRLMDANDRRDLITFRKYLLLVTLSYLIHFLFHFHESPECMPVIFLEMYIFTTNFHEKKLRVKDVFYIALNLPNIMSCFFQHMCHTLFVTQ